MILKMLGSEQRGAIERWVRTLAVATPMPNGNTLCRVLGTYPFVVSLNDISIAPHLALDGYWEMWVTMCLARRIKRGWHCVDVGAAWGYYSVLLADLVGESGRVEAWEPQKDYFHQLAHTLRLNGLLDRITIMPAAAGAGDAQRGIMVRLESTDYGSGKVMPPTLELDEPAQEDCVPILPLTATTLPRVDFVKIDAEGAEPEIWEGMRTLAPQAVLIEWNAAKYADAGAFLETIRRDGYSIGRVNQHGDVDVVPAADDVTLRESRHWEALWLERGTE